MHTALAVVTFILGLLLGAVLGFAASIWFPRPKLTAPVLTGLGRRTTPTWSSLP